MKTLNTLLILKFVYHIQKQIIPKVFGKTNWKQYFPTHFRISSLENDQIFVLF